jgi:hypothetical protein
MADFKSTSIYNQNEGWKLISANILNIVDEQIFSAGIDPVMDTLGYINETLEIPNGEFTSMLGTHGLEKLGEFDEYPIINKEQGYKKGYEVQRYGSKVAISKSLRKWIDASTSSAKLDPSTKSELSKLSRDVQRLINASKITRNEVATNVFAEGFTSAAAYGAGSASPDGQPLFSNSHVIKSTGATTNDNLVSGALTQAKLEEAIELLRNMKDGMGRTMKRARSYQLVVAPQGEAAARKLLNEGSKFAASVGGTETNNSITENIFTWDGFRIELVVLDTLNQPSADGSTIGSATMWFVLNREASREMEAFKFLSLYNDEMTMYVDDATKVMYFDLDLSFTCDHYNPECVVGSTGV